RDVAPFTRVSIIEASHFAPGTAYLAANRYQLDDMAPFIYRTSDYGHSWSKIVRGIPATEFVRVVREDPTRRGLLYAGTERVEWGGGFGGGGSDAHPVGKNPPRGAMIYYWLKNKNQDVRLDILDAAGRLIRSFSSRQDSLTAADSARGDSVKHQRTDSLKQAG